MWNYYSWDEMTHSKLCLNKVGENVRSRYFLINNTRYVIFGETMKLCEERRTSLYWIEKLHQLTTSHQI